jgi:hypothetical protein
MYKNNTSNVVDHTWSNTNVNLITVFPLKTLKDVKTGSHFHFHLRLYLGSVVIEICHFSRCKIGKKFEDIYGTSADIWDVQTRVYVESVVFSQHEGESEIFGRPKNPRWDARETKTFLIPVNIFDALPIIKSTFFKCCKAMV